MQRTPWAKQCQPHPFSERWHVAAAVLASRCATGKPFRAADGGTCSTDAQGTAEPEAHLGGKKIRQAALTFIMKSLTVPEAGCR